MSEMRIRLGGLLAFLAGSAFAIAYFMLNDPDGPGVEGFIIFPSATLVTFDLIDFLLDIVYILGGLFAAGVGISMMIRPHFWKKYIKD
jgi:hypothetical protein